MHSVDARRTASIQLRSKRDPSGCPSASKMPLVAATAPALNQRPERPIGLVRQWCLSEPRCGLRRRGDTLSSSPSRAIKPKPEAEIAKAVRLLNLMLEFLPTTATERAAVMMTENGGHCLVDALLHLSRKHRLPTAARSFTMQCPGPAFILCTSMILVATGPSCAL